MLNVLCVSRGREIKRAAMPLTASARDGLISGYASLFNSVDGGRDEILPGAFRDSLRVRGPAAVKMLWQHDASQPIGTWLSIEENARGLKVRGQLNLNVARARECMALMQAGSVDGLSIGFVAERARVDAATGIRKLAQVSLWEISIVTFPMQPQARVAMVAHKRALPLARIAEGRADVLQMQLARLVWHGRANACVDALDRRSIDELR